MSVAVIGAVVAIGGTAYGIYSQQQAVSAANSVKPKPFVPIDIPKTAAAFLAANEAGFGFSDAKWKEDFPKLWLGREYSINDARNNLSGSLSPNITKSLETAGLSSDIGGNNEFQKARDLGRPILSLEQRDRGYFQNLMQQNPQRQAAMPGSVSLQLQAQNTGAQNAYNSSFFGNQINQYNAQVAQGIQNQNAAIAGLGSLAGLIAPQQSNQSGYLSPEFYGNFSTGKYGSGG